MKQIKPSEIKPGMKVEWTHAGITRKCVALVVEESAASRHSVNLRTFEGGAMHIPGGMEVTVLSEPVQPKKPTEFGARVVVKGRRFLRAPEGKADSQPWLEENEGVWREWDELCAMGQVTVIDGAPSWTVPEQATDTPEVPERIEEWPEDDAHLREQRWLDRKGAVWSSRDGQWGYHSFTRGWVGRVAPYRYPFDGPWVRVP